MRSVRFLLLATAVAALTLAPTAGYALPRHHHGHKKHAPAATPAHRKAHGKSHQASPAAASEPSVAPAAPITATPGLRAAPTRPKS